MRARLCASTATRAIGSLGLGLLLLLGGPGPVAADPSGRAESEFPPLTRSSAAYHLLPGDSRDRDSWMTVAETDTDPPPTLGLGPLRPADTPLRVADPLALSALWTRPCPIPGLRSGDSSACERRAAAEDLAMSASPRLDREDSELPRSAFLERHRVLFSTLIPITSMFGVTANAVFGYDTHEFRVHHEGWFGENTTNGGADKASHITDYFVIANLFNDVYRMLGWSERASILWGFGVAAATGLANEVGDGFTRHGFSWEDLGADTGGAAAATLVALTGTRDLFGMRTSHLPSSTYTHDVYSADLKLSGIGDRLDLNIGPLRWLLLSVTYNAKGYRVSPPIEHQRQVGFEIGLNLQQILNDVGVKKSTWWGYALHLVGDNIRFPYTAIGMRYELNQGKWHGPNAGNYD